jgi:hypothetical protein
MNCPNCSTQHPDDAAECPKCGIVLAKWRTAQASGSKSAEQSPTGDSSPLVLYGGFAAAVLAYWFFFRAPAPPTLPPRPATDSSTAASALGGAGLWSFKGAVLDLSSLTPAVGAVVIFAPSDQPTLNTYNAETDAQGNYSLQVPEALKGVSYAARITHSNISGAHIKGSAEDFPEERRQGMRCPKTPPDDSLQGQAGSTVTQDFFVCLKRR